MYGNENYTNGYVNGQNGQNQPVPQQGSAYSGNYYQTSGSVPEAAAYRQQTAPKPPKGKKKSAGGRFFKKTFACIGMGLCFGLFAGAGIYAVGETTGMFDKWQVTKQTEQVSSGLDETTGSVAGDDGTQQSVINTANITGVTSDVSDVVAEVMPSMVSIVNNYVERVSYFGQAMEREGSSGGSGIIVGENDTELLIATNYHVVEDAKKLTVYFIDDTEVEAVLKGADPDMDLAVIAVALSDLSEETKNAISIAKMGDSEELELGEQVIAIGNALGYGQSVTGGWVSALNREVELEDGSKGTFIQTDAAINPGNSGGALLNIKGEVIGINSNKIGGTVIEGIGYAIPISAAQPILEELMTKETRNKVEEGNSGYLGIVPQSVTADVAELYGMPEGVFVSRMDAGTPAEAGGLLRGDIITKLDGNKVSTAEELRELLLYYEAGETIELTVMRNDNGEYQEITLSVTLGSRPDTES